LIRSLEERESTQTTFQMKLERFWTELIKEEGATIRITPKI
jgi:hypothetical protein